MATMYKISIIVYGLIQIIFFENVFAECNETFNPSVCAIELYCKNAIEFRLGFDRYKLQNYNPNYNEHYPENVENCDTIIYDGDNFYPMHIIYEDSIPFHQLTTTIPYVRIYDDDARQIVHNLITYIDLSNNSYSVMPKFKHVENLAVLNLSYNTLESMAEGQFDPFKKLQTLDLSHNLIQEMGQMTFEGLKHLVRLNLSFNSISDVNSSLFRFIGLKVLDLSFNNIKDIKASDFNMLVNLETLDLSNNILANIEKNAFHNMNLLINLNLESNRLVNLDTTVFINVDKLVDIDIANNNFKKLPRGLFKNKTIHYFSIANNELEGAIDRGTFEGLSLVNKLDLGYQKIDFVGDDAFIGLDTVEELLLNNNNIQKLSLKSFRMKPTLKRLDLSYNQIENIDFDKVDLYHLNILLLRNNKLTIVKQENFHGLNSLQFLDLSLNKITQIQTNSFLSLKELINFEISNNPLNGTLESNTFDGLNSLPSLDISSTSLTSVQNGSFSGMTQLNYLNISHSKINMIEYNSFIHTGTIQTIDLSFNNLNEFVVNATELIRLDRLYLNNNFMKTLNADTTRALTKLTVLSISHNMVENIDPDTLINMNLRELDISYNPIKVTTSLLNQSKFLKTLHLSGIKTTMSFDNIGDVSISDLLLRNSSISDMKTLHINKIRHLDTLTLSNNAISKLEYDGFANITYLKYLDISYNIITYIQPGVFQDNTLLYSLDISHNYLTHIPYGMFKGLIHLNTLDISYNKVTDFVDERFYGAKSLSIVIADHNKIESIDAEEFQGTSLTYLSIGDNPIPCKLLVNLNRTHIPFKITASRLDFIYNENFHGISCNKKTDVPSFTTNRTYPLSDDGTKVLLNIRDILLNHFNSQATSTDGEDDKYIINTITNRMERTSSNLDGKILQLMNSTNRVSSNTNDTNVLLQKILRVLTISARKSPPVEISKVNLTYDNFVTYINKLKQDMEDNLTLEKSNIIDEVDTKIAKLNSQFKAKLLKDEPKHEQQHVDSTDSKSIFTETCVGLILGILLCFIFFKIYRSGILVAQSFSISSRELTRTMDSTL